MAIGLIACSGIVFRPVSAALVDCLPAAEGRVTISQARDDGTEKSMKLSAGAPFYDVLRKA